MQRNPHYAAFYRRYEIYFQISVAYIIRNPLFSGAVLGWNNINHHVTFSEEFTLLYVMAMLLFDAVFYMAIALYIDALYPGKYGIPKRWDFPIRVRCSFYMLHEALDTS